MEVEHGPKICNPVLATSRRFGTVSVSLESKKKNECVLTEVGCVEEKAKNCTKGVEPIWRGLSPGFHIPCLDNLFDGDLETVI
jgi:hypothetical protein